MFLLFYYSNNSVKKKLKIKKMSVNLECDAVRIQQQEQQLLSPYYQQHDEENPQISIDNLYNNKDDFYYRMNHNYRGLAIIFNHKIYEPYLRLTRRYGTNRDCKRLERLFKFLGFHLEICNDFKYDQVRTKLFEISKLDHSQNDCLWICILTHGQDGHLYAKDSVYKIDDLINYFKANNCTTLAGKPKIITFQACQGQRADIGYPVSLIRKDSNRIPQYNIPTTADFILCYSSSPGYASFRHTSRGSWYIKELCKQLEKNAYNFDFFMLLTIVAQNVAFKYRTTTSKIYQQCLGYGRTHEQQMPYFTSTLTKILQFQPARNAGIS